MHSTVGLAGHSLQPSSSLQVGDGIVNVIPSYVLHAINKRNNNNNNSNANALDGGHERTTTWRENMADEHNDSSEFIPRNIPALSLLVCLADSTSSHRMMKPPYNILWSPPHYALPGATITTTQNPISALHSTQSRGWSRSAVWTVAGDGSGAVNKTESENRVCWGRPLNKPNGIEGGRRRQDNNNNNNNDTVGSVNSRVGVDCLSGWLWIHCNCDKLES